MTACTRTYSKPSCQFYLAHQSLQHELEPHAQSRYTHAPRRQADAKGTGYLDRAAAQLSFRRFPRGPAAAEAPPFRLPSRMAPHGQASTYRACRVAPSTGAESIKKGRGWANRRGHIGTKAVCRWKRLGELRRHLPVSRSPFPQPSHFTGKRGNHLPCGVSKAATREHKRLKGRVCFRHTSLAT